MWSPVWQVAETADRQGKLSQFAEEKALQLALDIAEREEWPVLYLCTDSCTVANAPGVATAMKAEQVAEQK